jgi:hypothetical protein
MATAKIYCIDSIDLTLIKTDPPGLIVGVTGRVVSTGWKNLELSTYVYLEPPADPIQDFDVVAQRPDSGAIVLPGLTPIRGDLALTPIDIDNYWGPGKPLKGVRCHGVANAKTTLLEPQPGMPEMTVLTADEAATYTGVPAEGPSFASNVKPLFRPRDVSAMLNFGGFDLHSYDDVKANSARILEKLSDGSMPCDGAWPQADVDLFRSWIDGGMPA